MAGTEKSDKLLNNETDPSYTATITRSATSRNDEIEIEWLHYIQMFRNVGWNDIPNTYQEAMSNSKHYESIIQRIYQCTDNDPTRIRNRQQFINQLLATTVYQNNKQFITKHCPKQTNPTFIYDEHTPLTSERKQSNGYMNDDVDNEEPKEESAMHDETDFIQMCDTPSDAPADRPCPCCTCNCIML